MAGLEAVVGSIVDGGWWWWLIKVKYLGTVGHRGGLEKKLECEVVWIVVCVEGRGENVGRTKRIYLERRNGLNSRE